MKKLVISLATGLMISILLSLSQFSVQCQTIRDDVLRLHILANSDSYEDQQLKLKVRDAILANTDDVFASTNTKDEAIANASQSLAQIEQIAAQVIKENGYDYAVKAEVVNMYFTTRQYDNYTLPAGYYDAIRITIGKAEGKNWWCVMFPQLCLPAVSEQEPIDMFDEAQQDIIENGEKYKASFFIIEWLEQLKAK